MTIKDKPSKANNGQLPAGFRFAGVRAGIKPSGKPDLALIVTDSGAAAAGVYTQNQIVAAPVVLSKSRTPSDSIRAVVTNSGNANACTGQQGLDDAQEMTRRVAELVGCDVEQVLVMSTGIIGQTLPMEGVRRGIDAATSELATGLDAFNLCAEAILTTDRSRKTVHRIVTVGDQNFSVAAMAKGAGMIAPNMATLLGVILTDAPLSPQLGQKILTQAAQASFNRVSVDGHTSTNDTLLLLSSGQGPELAGEALKVVQTEIEDAAVELATMLVADGEGASHVIALTVRGASDELAATEIAKLVAASPLVKTAITGGDPNWGRIISAAGNANAIVDPANTSLRIFDTTIYKNGAPVDYDAAVLSQRMQTTEEVEIDLVVGKGEGQARFWASDLTAEYVRFNSEYTT